MGRTKKNAFFPTVLVLVLLGMVRITQNSDWIIQLDPAILPMGRSVFVMPTQRHLLDTTKPPAVGTDHRDLSPSLASRKNRLHAPSTGYNHTKAQDPKQPQQFVPTIPLRRHHVALVVQLRGEMANHLSFLAHAYGMKLRIERADPHLDIVLVAQHPAGVRGRDTIRSILQCFPQLVANNVTFVSSSSEKWDHHHRRYEQLQMHMDRTYHKRMNKKHSRRHQNLQLSSTLPLWTNVDHLCPTGNCWRTSLVMVQAMLRMQHDYPDDVSIQDPHLSSTLTLPFLRSEKMSTTDSLVEEFLPEIQDLFAMNRNACCPRKPDPNETVFHLRNFAQESLHLRRQGFEEMGPQQVATELLGHLPRGSNVTIVTRNFGNNQTMGSSLSSSSSSSTLPSTTIAAYVHALERRGLHTRVISSASGMEDFCYLQSVQKELIGCKLSTFVLWAGLLGHAKTVTYYVMDSDRVRKYKPNQLRHYVFRREEIANRIQFTRHQEVASKRGKMIGMGPRHKTFSTS